MHGIPTDPRKAILTIRIIWAALILGQGMFFVIAIALRGELAKRNIDFLPYIAMAFAAAMIPAGFIVRRLQIDKGKREGRPMQGLAVGTILFLACCEGPSFLGSVSLLVTGNLATAAWVSAMATMLMLLAFPREEQLAG